MPLSRTTTLEDSGLRFLHALPELVDAMATAETSARRDAIALDAVLGVVGADRGAIVRRQGDTWRCVDHRGLSEGSRRAIEGSTLWTEGPLGPEPLRVEHIEEAGPLLLLEREGIAAIASFPFARAYPVLGTLVACYDASHRFTESEVAALATLARHLAVERGSGGAEDAPRQEARMLQEERAELLRQRITAGEAEKARRRAAFLAEATRILASSLEYRGTLDQLAHASVPLLADGCVVDLLGDDGAVQRVAAAHVAPDKEAQIRELLAPRAAARGDESERDPHENRGRGRLLDAARVRLFRDIESVMVVPLESGERVLGTITFIRARSGAYGPEDLDFAHDLARRAASAIVNARLFLQAQEANRLKDEFLATLSHELRTPLNAILGWAHLLRSGRLEPDKTEHAIETIERNARIQSQLIGDILDFSRITMGKVQLRVDRVPIGEAIEAAVEAARPAAEAKGVRIETEIDPSAAVFGDAERIQQIVGNLLSNAIKFSDRGGRVRIEAARTERVVRIAVRDHGLGMPAEFLPNVFDRFRQADGSSTRARGGLGLGLAIARHLVQLHGGSVEAASDGEGRGATFTVVLPMRSVVTATAPVENPRGATAGEARTDGLAGLRILAVDDEPDARDLFRTLLEGCGAEVWTAGSAGEALERLPDARPDLLLVDIGMAGEDGYSLMRKLRARPPEAGGATPAIALTAFARDQDRQKALAAGCQLHVTKPVEPETLLQAILQVVGATPFA